MRLAPKGTDTSTTPQINGSIPTHPYADNAAARRAASVRPRSANGVIPPRGSNQPTTASDAPADTGNGTASTGNNKSAHVPAWNTSDPTAGRSSLTNDPTATPNPPSTSAEMAHTTP
jgi:hypothetical protein